MTKSKLFMAVLLAPLAIATVNVTAANANGTVDPGYSPNVRPKRPYSPPLGPVMRVPNKKKCATIRGRLVCK
jgi:hypothetical protein